MILSNEIHCQLATWCIRKRMRLVDSICQIWFRALPRTNTVSMTLWAGKEFIKNQGTKTPFSKAFDKRQPFTSPNFNRLVLWLKSLRQTLNFTCYPDWSRSAQLKHHFWVFVWGCFWMRLVFELVTRESGLPFPVWLGTIHFVEGLERTRGRERRSLPFYFSTSRWSWDFSSLLRPSDGDIHDLFSGSQAFGLGLNDTTHFPGLYLADSRSWDF